MARQLGLELAARAVERSSAARAAAAAVKRAFQEPRPTTGRGGRRRGAGRKPSGARAGQPHGVRPFLSSRHPVHVVLRLTREVGRLRKRSAYHAFRRALITSLARVDFRVVHVSIQAGHIHLICEAHDRLALSRGVRGLSVSAAHRLNAATGRRGRVFMDRYHATAITTPRQARSALAYVLNNWRHHGEDRGGAWIDVYSSGITFPGWAGREGIPFAWPRGYEPLPIRFPRTWLLSDGWRRWGAVGLDEVPG